MERSTASTAILPANAGGRGLSTWRFHLPGLPGGGGGVQGLAHGLENRLNIQTKQGADTCGGGGTEVRDVVDLVLVQANGLDQVHLDLVPGGDGTDQVGAVGANVLGNGQDRRDVIAGGVGIVSGQERVVVIQFAHRHAIGPGSPLGGETCPVIPNTAAPLPLAEGAWVSAWARAATIGARFNEAMATEALSMIRLITMSVTSGGVTSTGSAATTAILCANCSSRGRFSSDL